MRVLAILLLLSTAALAADVTKLSDADLRAAWVDVCVQQQTMNGGSMPKEFFAECEPLRIEWTARQAKVRANINAEHKAKLKEILEGKK